MAGFYCVIKVVDAKDSRFRLSAERLTFFQCCKGSSGQPTRLQNFVQRTKFEY